MLLTEETNDDKVNKLRYAIENKFTISFWYRGIKVTDPNNKKYKIQNWRFAEPVALGRSTATNKLMLRAWQTGGATNTQRIAWKTFLLDEMQSITVMDGKDGGYKAFEKPSGFNYNDSGDKKMAGGRPDIKIDLNKKPTIFNKEEPQIEPIKESNGFFDWMIKILK